MFDISYGNTVDETQVKIHRPKDHQSRGITMFSIDDIITSEIAFFVLNILLHSNTIIERVDKFVVEA